MAQPPAPSDAFLREVDEELRRDQIAAAWKRWGRIGIVAIIVGLLLLAGRLYWNNRATEQAGVEAEQLKTAYEGLSGGDRVEAEATLSRLAESQRDGHRALAQLAQADQLLAGRDAKGAAARFAAIATDTSLGQPFRDLALLRRTLIEFDTLPPQTVVERMRPLATPGSAWFPTAAELTAIAHARQGRRDLAGRLFGQIARQENAPETTRQRAVQMASAMGVDAAPAPSPNPGVTPQP